MNTSKTIFSGIQPSGTLHIGNYLGAIKQWVELQHNNNAYYCIVDQHAITVPYNKGNLASNTLETAAMYLAAEVDPEKSTIFIQSHVPAHTELAWLLGATTPSGELKRMTQFKDKSEKQQGKETLGLFAYPVLMAADILLYNTEVVPVGDDQIQHVELARKIAKRFNNKFGKTFTIPEPLVNKETKRIMSLTDPTRKMSKSDDPKHFIRLNDDNYTIQEKVKAAVTETEPIFSFTESGPAVKNMLIIYQAFNKETTESIEQKFTGSGYKEFKEDLTNLLIEKLTPIREKYEEIKKDKNTLKQILTQGKEKAEQVADKTLSDVKEKMGFA